MPKITKEIIERYHDAFVDELYPLINDDAYLTNAGADQQKIFKDPEFRYEWIEAQATKYWERDRKDPAMDLRPYKPDSQAYLKEQITKLLQGQALHMPEDYAVDAAHEVFVGLLRYRNEYHFPFPIIIFRNAYIQAIQQLIQPTTAQQTQWHNWVDHNFNGQLQAAYQDLVDDYAAAGRMSDYYQPSRDVNDIAKNWVDLNKTQVLQGWSKLTTNELGVTS